MFCRETETAGSSETFISTKLHGVITRTIVILIFAQITYRELNPRKEPKIAGSTFFFTLALVGAEWPASRSDLFTPWERATETHWIGG
jgi:hypothetical protein